MIRQTVVHGEYQLRDKDELYKGVIISNEETAPGHFLISISLPGSFPRPKPGQFVMIKPERRSDLLLSRPVSVYGFQDGRDCKTVTLFYRVIGKGTEQLSLMTSGSLINLLGPLGSCFIIPERALRVLLVAGGMGIAPLTYLASEINNGVFGKPVNRERVVIGYIGVQSADRIIGIDELQKKCSKTAISTDDGSFGCSGLVTDMLLNDLIDYNAEETAVYACGPEPMIKCIADMLIRQKIFCQVSVEQRMACGIGACLGCAVKIKTPKGTSYKRTCKEGPVFSISDLVFDE